MSVLPPRDWLKAHEAGGPHGERLDTDTALELYLDALHRSGETERGLHIASKAVYGLYRRGAGRAAMVLGNAALRQAGEPTPKPGLFPDVGKSLATTLRRTRPGAWSLASSPPGRS